MIPVSHHSLTLWSNFIFMYNTTCIYPQQYLAAKYIALKEKLRSHRVSTLKYKIKQFKNGH